VMCALITVGIQVGGFTVAWILKTETFYDILGGVNYFALVAYTFESSAFSDARKLASTAVFIASRSWLLGFLAWRAHERGGDSRFDEILGKTDKPANAMHFLIAWLMQGSWCFLISMPMLFVNSSTIAAAPFSVYDYIMLVGFAAGITIEVLGDVQKSVWVKAGRQGGFCQVGIWAWSRHPNYFGEMLQWWCHFGLALSSSPYGSNALTQDWLWWLCALSPLFTMQILLNVPETGIAQAEGKGLKRYYEKCPEEYMAYRSRTSVLVPMPSALWQPIPLFLKRLLFFEFSKYEYRPKQKKGQ